MKKSSGSVPKDDGRAEVSGEKSPEYLAFEAFAKQVLSVPKDEIDRREEEERKGRVRRD